MIGCGCRAEHACANQVIPGNGELVCRHLDTGVECRPSCHSGFDFAVVPADKYFCDYDDGLWTPATRWPVRDCACAFSSTCTLIIIMIIISVELAEGSKTTITRPSSSAPPGREGGHKLCITRGRRLTTLLRPTTGLNGISIG